VSGANSASCARSETRTSNESAMGRAMRPDATIGDDASMESPQAMRHFIHVRYRTILDDAVLKTRSGRSRSWIRIPPLRPPVWYISATFWRKEELRAEGLSARSAESISSCRIRLIRRALSSNLPHPDQNLSTTNRRNPRLMKREDDSHRSTTSTTAVQT
jgi:hypothetical protein